MLEDVADALGLEPPQQTWQAQTIQNALLRADMPLSAALAAGENDGVARSRRLVSIQTVAQMCTTEWGVELPARARSRDTWLKVLKDAVDTGAIPRNLQREVCCACYLQKTTVADDERKRYGKSWPLEPAERWRAQAFRACALAHHEKLTAAHT